MFFSTNISTYIYVYCMFFNDASRAYLKTVNNLKCLCPFFPFFYRTIYTSPNPPRSPHFDKFCSLICSRAGAPPRPGCVERILWKSTHREQRHFNWKLLLLASLDMCRFPMSSIDRARELRFCLICHTW